MEIVWEDLRQCHRLRNEMAHLVTSLQAYIMFEVVEAAWTEFMDGLATTKDLDILIRKCFPSKESFLQQFCIVTQIPKSHRKTRCTKDFHQSISGFLVLMVSHQGSTTFQSQCGIH